MATIYQYTLSYADVAGRATLNSFPIAVFDTEASGVASGPLNHLLVAGENTLRVKVSRRGPDGSLAGKVAAVEGGSMVDTSAENEFSLPAGAAPVEVEYSFSSETNALGGLLETLQPIDVAAATTFAVKLRDVIRSGDAGAIAALFRPKFQHLAAAMDVPAEAIAPELENIAATFGGADLGFGADDLTLEPCCDGKLVPLIRGDGTQAIRLVTEDGSTEIDAAVGITPGGPALVI